MKSLFSVLLLMLMLRATLLAQSPADKKDVPPKHLKTVLPAAAPLLQGPMINAINSRASGAAVKDVGPALLPVAKQDFYAYVKQLYGDKQLQQVQKGFGLLKDTARIGRYLDEKLRGFYALKGNTDVAGFLKAGAYSNRFKGAAAEAFTDNAAGALMPAVINARIQDNVTLGNIPVNLQFTHIAGQSFIDRDALNNALGKVSFDKEAYIERMNQYVNKAFDLNKYFLQDIDVRAAFKDYADKKLQKVGEDMSRLVADKGQQLTALSNLISPEQLIYLDSNQIKNLVLDIPGFQVEEARLLSDLPDSALSPKTAMARRYLHKLWELKSTLSQGLTAQQTLATQTAVENSIRKGLNNNDSKVRNIKELLPLNFLQRLLLQAKSLQAGKIAAGEKGSVVKDLFMSGAAGSFLNDDKFMMLGAGVRNDAADIKNIGLNEGVDPSSFSMQFLQLGKGDVSGPHSHIGIVNANSRAASGHQLNPNTLARNVFVGAVSEQVSLGEYGTIAAEISKSNSEYRNAAAGNDYALTSKAAAFTLFNDFWQTISVGLDYTGTVKSLDLSQRAYISYSGLGYSNPAAPGSARGTVRYGLNLRRSWNKRRVTVGFRADLQDMRMSALTNSHWKNSAYTMDARVKVKKNFSLSTRIGQSVMKGISDKMDQPGYVNRHISLSSQYSGKLWSLPQSNNVTFSLQQMDILPVKSLLVNLNVNQSFIINANMLTVSLMYNKDVKGQALYGDLLTAETGWSYTVLKKLACTSGITYLNNKTVVEQAGVKQSVGTELLPRLNVNLYLDCRKNIVNTTQNYLFGNFSTQLMIHYLLN
ncbi:hypothetical protein HF324_31910 [Chitinophaga oryzae]|uniref:Uncharacterized protein n=1 Tax=Chitinophaga oryzae TaxID=2725414 RepID=A0ABX6LPW3_9BACT|nr:hypothetical protein [Chitinophaga oryzae]QJB42198.1 hypothetical protein HF324_31910 [Chitinophaga oryzae]